MTRSGLILVCIILSAVTRPAFAAQARYSVGADQVTTAIDTLGVRIVPDQVALLTDVASNIPSPRLGIRSVVQLDAGRFIFRLECEKEEDCLPFMASVQVDRDSAVRMSALFARLSLLKESFAGAAVQPKKDPIVIQSGERAMLLLDSERVHIRIPVICLQSGSAGESIRVSTPDHRQNYMAQVVKDGVLQGRLGQ